MCFYDVAATAIYPKGHAYSAQKLFVGLRHARRAGAMTAYAIGKIIILLRCAAKQYLSGTSKLALKKIERMSVKNLTRGWGGCKI
jgi:hypothetical protein